MTIKIFYGIRSECVNVTSICLNKLANENIITIPSGDCMRAMFIWRPIMGCIKKNIYIN